MNRIARGISSKISIRITDAGNLVDPDGDIVNVEVTADDGAILVGLTPATREDVGIYFYVLTPTDTAQLNWLTARWTGVLDGFEQTFTTRVEVVGGFLFSVEHAQADPDLAPYTADQILDARTLAEESLEDACDIAFVPRYQRETINGNGGYVLGLSKRKVRALRSISLDGTDFSVDSLASVLPYGSRWLHYGAATWTRGFSNYTIRYEHGLDRPPERVSRAALVLAKNWLIQGPVDDRATSLTTGDGTFALVTPGRGGALFDVPEVNAVVQQYGYIDPV